MELNQVECCLIKALYYNTIYIKYNNIIYNILNNNIFKKDNKELFKIYQSVCRFHEEFPDKDISSTLDLELYFYSLYPATNKSEKELLSALFAVLDKVNPDLEVLGSYIDASVGRQKGHRIALLGLDVAEGQKSWKDAVNEFNEVLEGFGDSSSSRASDPFVSSSLAEIYEVTAKSPGLRWPLDCLNKSLGSLRKGDYGFIFARPETGKTTFLAHIASFMASQQACENPIIWFNNEQEGRVVQAYCYRAALGVTNQQLYANIEENERKFKEITHDRIRIYDSASIHRNDVETILRQFGASLIVFDQIDKIKGFNSDRDDLELGAIYQWARELAKRYAPVIGVCQAGQTAANKRYLTMEDVVNSKTSKQAEADWILGIGKVEQEGYENVRHFHLSKNKLIGDADTIPELRHAKLDVLIEPQISRYKDIPNSK